MPDNVGGGNWGGKDGIIGAGRIEALKKLRAQREDLSETTLPDPLKVLRDKWLQGKERPGAQVQGWEVKPVEVRPKYGMAPVPADVPPGPAFELPPFPVEVRPKYGMAPIFDVDPAPAPIEVRPKYGMAPIPADWQPQPEPIEVRPKYGMAPIPADVSPPAPIEVRPKYGMAPIPADVQPAPAEFRPKYGMAPLPRLPVGDDG